MAATNTTRNKLNRARLMVYWFAQHQRTCHFCGRPLVGTRPLRAVDDLTVDHISNNYDHVARRERKGNGKGVRLMHRSCHKSMTMRHNKVWRHRPNLKMTAAKAKLLKDEDRFDVVVDDIL